MLAANWKEIGDAIAGLVAREPPFIRICIGLAVAFSALMFLEGLRASFVPRRGGTVHAAERTARSTPLRHALLQSISARAPARNPKRDAAAVKAHRAPRPKIRRTAPPPAKPQLPQVSSFEE